MKLLDFWIIEAFDDIHIYFYYKGDEVAEITLADLVDKGENMIENIPNSKIPTEHTNRSFV